MSGAEGDDKATFGGEEELVPRNGSSSVVWKCFGFRNSDVNQEKIICKECNRVVSAPQGNTTVCLFCLQEIRSGE